MAFLMILDQAIFAYIPHLSRQVYNVKLLHIYSYLLRIVYYGIALHCILVYTSGLDYLDKIQ